MMITHTLYREYPPVSQTLAHTEEMAQLGVHAKFRARPGATAQPILNSMERRERIVLILLDGKRTLQDVARLTHRNELEVARTLVQLLRNGYIDFLRT